MMAQVYSRWCHGGPGLTARLPSAGPDATRTLRLVRIASDSGNALMLDVDTNLTSNWCAFYSSLNLI